MTDRPWMPIYWGDYLADTLDLGPDEHGVYLLMIGMAWMRPDGALPDDMAMLKRMLGGCCRDMHGNRFNRIVPPILERFWTRGPDGKWRQKRVEKEREKAKKRSRNASESASKRWHEPRRNNMLDDAVAMHARARQPHLQLEDSESNTNSESESPPKVADTSIVASGKPRQPRRHAYTAEFERFWQVYPKRPTDTKASACKAWDKAVANDVAEPILQTGAERYAAYANRSGCETMLVQTWINREGWTASYTGGAHGNGKHSNHKREDWYGRRLMEECFGPSEAQPDTSPDSPEPERRSALKRG